MFIYENDKDLLVGLRGIYDVEQTNIRNHLPVPGQYLSKCRISKIELSEDDFIKLIKVKHSTVENRIVKLQIRSNKNNKYEYGDKRAFSDIMGGQTVYGFDIQVDQYPVCLFGSLMNVKNHWFLESIGVEINDL